MPVINQLRLVLVTLFSCSLVAGACAQDVDSTPPKKVGYIGSYWHNGLALIASPIHWRGDEWAKAGGTLVVTGVILSMDEPISQPFFNWQTEFATGFGKTGRTLGSVPFQLGISGVALGVGALAHSKPIQNFALDNLQAQIFTGAITALVKELSHRARPFTGEGAYAWYGPFKKGGSDDYRSFFSGHASVSFCTATMIFLHSKKKWWVGLISYGTAAGIAVSRMQTQAHWASDVVLGSVIGSAVAGFVYKQQEKRRNPVEKLKPLP